MWLSFANNKTRESKNQLLPKKKSEKRVGWKESCSNHDLFSLNEIVAVESELWKIVDLRAWESYWHIFTRWIALQTFTRWVESEFVIVNCFKKNSINFLQKKFIFLFFKKPWEMHFVSKKIYCYSKRKRHNSYFIKVSNQFHFSRVR